MRCGAVERPRRTCAVRAPPLRKSCGHPGGKTLRRKLRRRTPAIAPSSRCRRPRIQPKLYVHELRLLGACGKERIGFPQDRAGDQVEIRNPVDPEIWKRYCQMICCLLVMFSRVVEGDSYWDRGFDASAVSFRPGNIAPACGYRKA